MNPFIEAAASGCLEAVQALIGRHDPKAEKSLALRFASEHGHMAVVDFLLPHSCDEGVEEVLVHAAMTGEAGRLRRCLAQLPATFNADQALFMAAQNGCLENVALLIPITDPKAHQSVALRVALDHQHQDVIALLAMVSDLPVAMHKTCADGLWIRADRLGLLLPLPLMEHYLLRHPEPAWPQCRARLAHKHHQVLSQLLSEPRTFVESERF